MEVSAAERRWCLFTTVVVIAGIILRIQQYLLGRSLWIDEARLALSIVPASDSQLLGPLLYDQVAPPAFLAVSRLFVLTFGPSELSLRLLSLIAGAAALVVTACLARRIAGTVAAALAALMLSLSPAAIYYSQEFKHYSCDLLVGVLLPMLALAASGLGPKRLARYLFVAACAVSVWFSASAIVVAAGTLGAVLAIGVIGRRRSVVVMGTVASALTACSFGVAYWVSFRFAANGDLMQAFWDGAYLNIGSMRGVLESFALLLSVGMGMLAGPRAMMGYVVTGSDAQETVLALVTLGVLAASAWGALRLVRQGASDQLMVLLGSGAVFTVVSLLEAYPASTRLLMFLAGPWAVLASIGLKTVVEKALGARGRYLAICVVCTSCVAGAPADGKWRMANAQWSEARAFVKETVASGSPLYLYARAVPQYMYYATDWPSPHAVRMAALYRVSDYGGVAFENAAEFRAGGSSPELEHLARSGLVVGLSTGRRFSPSFGWSRPGPAPDWAEAEVARIGRQVASHVALLFLHHIDGAATSLRKELDRNGWSCVEARRNYDESLLKCSRRTTSGMQQPSSMTSSGRRLAN